MKSKKHSRARSRLNKAKRQMAVLDVFSGLVSSLRLMKARIKSLELLDESNQHNLFVQRVRVDVLYSRHNRLQAKFEKVEPFLPRSAF